MRSVFLPREIKRTGKREVLVRIYFISFALHQNILVDKKKKDLSLNFSLHKHTLRTHAVTVVFVFSKVGGLGVGGVLLGESGAGRVRGCNLQPFPHGSPFSCPWSLAVVHQHGSL